MGGLVGLGWWVLDLVWVLRVAFGFLGAAVGASCVVGLGVGGCWMVRLISICVIGVM